MLRGRYHLALSLIVATTTACGTSPVTEPTDEEARPTTIEVSTPAISMASLGATSQASAVVRDQNGGAMPGQSVTWTPADPGVATVSATGLVTAVGNGNTPITVTAGTLTTTLNITVDQVADTMEPTTDTLRLSGASDQALLGATVLDALGSEIAGAALTWSIDDEGIATIDADGLVVGVSPGSTFATVASSAGGANVTVDVDVIVNSLSMGITDFCGDFAPEAEPAFAAGGLENRVRDKLGIGTDDTLTCAMLATIDSMIVLPLFGTIVPSLGGAQNLVGLDSLWVAGQPLSDLGPLAQLPTLSYLSVANTEVDDAGLAPLATLTPLRWLGLGFTEVSDLSPLSGLTDLEVLDVNSSNVTDLAPISGLTSLTFLSVAGTDVSDLGPISGLSSLEILSLARTDVSSLQPIAGRTSLRELYFDDTDVSDLSPLLGLGGLTRLWMARTGASDLSHLIGLNQVTDLNAAQNGISDLEGMQGMTNLRTLDLSANPITDIAHLSSLVWLTRLELNGLSSGLSNIIALQYMANLTYLDLAGNSAITDIQPLIANTGLGVGDQVFLQLTSASCDDVNALRGQGAEVTASLCPPP